MKRILSLSICLAMLAAVALAHGDEQHLMGTVTKVTEHTIIIEMKDKKTAEVHLVAATKFEKGDKAATLKDLKVGDRVVVHAKKGDKVIATVIKIGIVTPQPNKP